MDSITDDQIDEFFAQQHETVVVGQTPVGYEAFTVPSPPGFTMLRDWGMGPSPHAARRDLYLRRAAA